MNNGAFKAAVGDKNIATAADDEQEQVERRGTEWRILERVIAYSWRRTDPAIGPSGFAESYVRGIRGTDDIVYTIGRD